MGNEFNGKKFDYWSGLQSGEYGVWNNDMKAKQYIPEWNGTVAPSKEAAILEARRRNKTAEQYNSSTNNY